MSKEGTKDVEADGLSAELEDFSKLSLNQSQGE